MPANDLDRVFRPEQSDVEMGDAYERAGFSGVYQLEKSRHLADLAISGGRMNESHLRTNVAIAFGCSPGDIVAFDEDCGMPQMGVAQAQFMGLI